MFSLSGKTGAVFDESTGQFNHVDSDEAKRELKLSRRASDNGAKGIPEPRGTKKDALAAEIDAYINYLISLAKTKLLEKNRAIKDLSESQSQGSIQDITEIYETATKELTATARNFYDRMFILKNNWILAGKYLKDFREKNNLNRPAQYPDDWVRKLGFIFVIVIIETIFNAYALGDAHPSGIFGVGAVILMFSIVNAILSFFLGFFVWRYFFHVQKLKRGIATILACVIIVFILFLNFLLAHYRDAISKLVTTIELTDLQTSIQKLGGQAMDTLIANPFSVDDIISYLLLFFGLAVAAITTWKSFELDDPYPGYGKQSREQEKLAKRFTHENNNALEDIIDLVEDYSKQISSQRLLMKSNFRAVNRREEDFRDLHNKYKIWLKQTESVGKALYAHYQEENIKARETKTKPKCFGLHDYVLPDDAKVELDFPKYKPLDIEAVEATEEKYVAELNKKAKNYFDKFTYLAQASADEELGDEFKAESIFPAEGR